MPLANARQCKGQGVTRSLTHDSGLFEWRHPPPRLDLEAFNISVRVSREDRRAAVGVELSHTSIIGRTRPAVGPACSNATPIPCRRAAPSVLRCRADTIERAVAFLHPLSAEPVEARPPKRVRRAQVPQQETEFVFLRAGRSRRARGPSSPQRPTIA